MLRCKGIPILEYWKLKKIARQVRWGTVPKGVDKETIWKALKLTAPSNATEMFGFLSAIILHSQGGLIITSTTYISTIHLKRTKQTCVKHPMHLDVYSHLKV